MFNQEMGALCFLGDMIEELIWKMKMLICETESKAKW
jgi:hypothetical protein